MSISLETFIEKIDELIEYCDDTDFSEAVDFVNQYATTSEETSSNQQLEILATGKCRLIEAFADYDASWRAEPHLKDLCALHTQSNNPALTKKYAKALAYLAGDGYLTSEDVNLRRACELHELLKELTVQYPQHGLEEELMNSYLDFLHYYLQQNDIEEADKIFQEMGELYSDAPNSYINYLYARAFSYRIDFYTEKEAYESANGCFEMMLQIPDRTDSGIVLTVSGVIDTLVDLNIRNEQIQKAEELCDIHRKLAAKDYDDQTKSILQKRMAEVHVSLFNHYVLTEDMEAALLKYDELKQMEAACENPDVDERYGRAVYAMAVHFLEQYNFKEAVTYKKELERLYEKNKTGRNDLISYLCTVLRGFASNSEEAANSAFREDALRQLKNLTEKEPANSAKYNYAVALADLVCIGINNSHTTYQGYYLEELKKLTAQYPQIASLKEEYARAFLFLADNLNDKDESLEFIRQVLALPQPWNQDTFDNVSLNLYNGIVKLSDAKDEQRAEEWHNLHTELMQYPDISVSVILRQAKQLFNLHYDYSDKADFARAEEKYQSLKKLYDKYADSSLKDTDCPLGLSIAKRLMNAAWNYAADLKSKTPKKSFSLFDSPMKKSAKRVKQLQSDATEIFAKWKRYENADIQEAYRNIMAVKL